MRNPILVDVTRGDLIESRHAGAFAVSDADGKIVLSAGDIERPVYARSSVKAFQALPLLESGAADRYGLTDQEIALAVSSHSGEARHVATASAMLAKAGCAADALECGTHWPSNHIASNALAREGLKPNALHNNCSGKHAGFICTSCAMGIDSAGYVDAKHPVMRAVMSAVADMAGATMSGPLVGIDGCSIPTQAAPLASLARGFAQFGTGARLGPERAKAARRIRKAVAAAPFWVAGTGRFCTDIMTLFGERVFVKTGAEGVFCGCFPDLGYGVALKCDDGATRAAEVIMATLIARLATTSEAEREALAPFLRPALRNWNGMIVGHLRAAEPLG